MVQIRITKLIIAIGKLIRLFLVNVSVLVISFLSDPVRWCGNEGMIIK
jgi:hypothetical protein